MSQQHRGRHHPRPICAPLQSAHRVVQAVPPGSHRISVCLQVAWAVLATPTLQYPTMTTLFSSHLLTSCVERTQLWEPWPLQLNWDIKNYMCITMTTRTNMQWLLGWPVRLGWRPLARSISAAIYVSTHSVMQHFHEFFFPTSRPPNFDANMTCSAVPFFQS